MGARGGRGTVAPPGSSGSTAGGRRFYKDAAAAIRAGWRQDSQGRWTPPIGKTVTLMPPVPTGTMATIRVVDGEAGVLGSFKVEDLGRVREFTFVRRPTGWLSDRARRTPLGAAPARLLKPVRGHLIPRSLMNSLQFSEARWNLIWQGASSNSGEFRRVENRIRDVARAADTRRVVVHGIVNFHPHDAYDVASVSFSGKVRRIGRDGTPGHIEDLFPRGSGVIPHVVTLVNQ